MLALSANGFLSQQSDLNYVQNLDVNRYIGTWYAVKEIPAYLGVYPFGYDSKDFVNETATYSLNRDGTIHVLNAAYINGKYTPVEGTARQVEGGKLAVSFFGPFYAPYQVIALDPNYEWAVVGSPNHNYLWYLSRTPTLSSSQLEQMNAAALANGFDISRLVFVK